jgi:Rps23 Pro-64 3,4-dihydroxylase Tpa1-like proline 4-hydroxylase
MAHAVAQQKFSLNSSLELKDLAEQFTRSGRIQIADFLGTGQAGMLRESLVERQDWALILNAGDKVYDISRETWGQMSGEQRQRLDQLTLAAARDGFHYRYESIRVADERDARTGKDLLTEFVQFMSSNEVLRFLGGIIGGDDLSFADGQATAYSNGHFLTAHTDNLEGKQRRAAYVLGLSPVWRPEWGGLLMFHDRDDNIEEAFTPKMGALRLFSVPVRHSVSYVNPLAPEPRLSVTGWLRADRPQG